MAISKIEAASIGYGGAVLQVVNATYSTTVTASGVTATGLTATITPKFATSKILVLISQQYSLANASAANLYGYFILYKNATQIYNNGSPSEIQGNSVLQVSGRWAINFTDSPATTSATTYSLSFNPQAGTCILQNNSSSSFITLMEIAA